MLGLIECCPELAAATLFHCFQDPLLCRHFFRWGRSTQCNNSLLLTVIKTLKRMFLNGTYVWLLISPRWDVCWLISLRMGYMLADFFSMGCVLADFSITCWSKHESSPRSNNLPSARPMWGESNSEAVGGILIDFQFNFEYYIVAHKAGY